MAPDPKKILFKRDTETIDLNEQLKEVVVRHDLFTAGAQVVNFGNLVVAKYLFLIADQPVQIQLNGGSSISILANREIEIWSSITSLTITASVSTTITLVLAGE